MWYVTEAKVLGAYMSLGQGVKFTSLGFREMTFPFFWDLNEIKHAKYLTQGLTHNIFSINMHHSSLSCVTLSIIVCLTFVPWEVEFCHLDIPGGGLGTMLEGGKKRVFISPAPQLWASVLAGAAFLFLWPSSNPEDPLP